MLPVIGTLRPWTDPSQLHLHRLPMHVPLAGFDRQILDGRWRLELFDHPDRVPPEALIGHRPAAVEVDVPGNWTMQDLGPFDDGPWYTNVEMPFGGPPPLLPARNPTGVYRRSVTVPPAWSTDRIVLRVGGAESVHAVYLNGRFAGYGTDSRLPSEYDVSSLVSGGANELAVVVFRFSAHSYVEDQDQWWMAGLHRSVSLERRPPVHVADVPIEVGYDHLTGRGTVAVTTRVDFGGQPEAGWMVRSSLADPDGNPIGRQRDEVPARHAAPYAFTGFVTTARWDLAEVEPWSAETPTRYPVTVELIDPEGTVVQTEVQRVGLRTVEVGDRQLLVNGQPVWVFGVNRHDHHPDRGKAVTVDDMAADLAAMRAHNITAIRTSHYPNDDAFYDLCDEHGFYVVDEANIESHGYNRSLCHDPTYRAAWLDRGARMVERDRNHPSVIQWSLGNESGYGPNHDALAGWIRRLDPSRPLHYEDGIRIEGWDDGGRPASDVVCPMYPTIDEIAGHGRSGVGDRPLIMCEYSHAMGNSNGSLADYWDVITSTPGLQGGFLWEWKDHGLRQRLADGRTRLAYGGQFGDKPNDGNFVADGLVSADGDPHPALREVAWVHRPVTVAGHGRDLRIENRRSFADLADLRAEWQLVTADGIVATGPLDVPPVGPGRGTTVAIPDGADDPAAGWLTVEWRTRDPSWWAPAGHVVAWDQIELSPDRARPAPPTGGASPDELVTPELTLWRAAVDNDGFRLMPDLDRRLAVGGSALRRWQEAGLDRLAPDRLVDHDVTVERTAEATTYRHVVDVPETLADLPRVGIRFALPARFGLVRWFGRGPHENYPDRNRSATIGRWEAGPDRLPYLVPQEFGLRTDCRWLELIDPDRGQRVRLDVLEPGALHASATNYRAEDLFEAATASELMARDELVVHLDVAHRGLGTASCGPDVLPRYRLAAGRYHFSYRVTLLE